MCLQASLDDRFLRSFFDQLSVPVPPADVAAAFDGVLLGLNGTYQLLTDDPTPGGPFSAPYRSATFTALTAPIPVSARVITANSETDLQVFLGVTARFAGGVVYEFAGVSHIPDDGSGRTIEVVARTRWTRVEFEPGIQGARAVAAVGVELVGGSRGALDRFESCVSNHQRKVVAGPEGLG